MNIRIGDRVRRKFIHVDPMVKGSEWIVCWVSRSGTSIQVADLNTRKKLPLKYTAAAFEVVGVRPIKVTKPSNKPWIKVTPPIPEKRELVPYEYGLSYSLTFSPDEKFAYLAWGPLIARSTYQSFTKDELRKLGETLIEISTEMK